MKYHLTLFFVMVLPLVVFSDEPGSLTLDQVQQFHVDLNLNGIQKAIQNALLNRQFSEVFINQEVLKQHNTYFTHEIKIGKITDQKKTGRCWLYGGLNTIRYKVAEQLKIKDFEFSENFLFFWDKIEKANTFLELVIERSHLDIRDEQFQRLLLNPMSDGGYWQNFVDLIQKYGCVPYETMPEFASNENSNEMRKNINYQLRYSAWELKRMRDMGENIESLRIKKQEILSRIYRMLVLHLGEPVKQFDFRYYIDDEKLTPYQKYTPKVFADRFVNEDLNKFIMFADWPGREYYRRYQLESSNNLKEGTPLTFINLPIDQIKKMTLSSILGNDPVNFSSDVGMQSLRKEGILNADLYSYQDVYGIPFDFDKRTNTVIRNINSTHAMVIVGVDLHEDFPIKWKVENSWGTDDGDEGVFTMYDNWFDLYVVRVVIHEKYIPKKIMRLTEQTPILIPENEPEQFE